MGNANVMLGSDTLSITTSRRSNALRQTLGHAERFVCGGARRVDSLGWDAQRRIELAFLNSKGQMKAWLKYQKKQKEQRPQHS